MAVVRTMVLAPAEYLLLHVALPGQPERCAGVLLLDHGGNRLQVRLRQDWRDIAGPEDARILEELQADLEEKSEQMGGSQLLAWLEDSLSNVLRLGSREVATARDLNRELDRLFHRHVQDEYRAAGQSPVSIQPYVTHVPVYSLKAAATKFGEDMEAAAEGWAEIPAGVRPDERLFVAQVIGRSMEPKIPDGSYCLFRAEVTGSRQNKLLLIRRAASAREGGEYTIKRYRSDKLITEEGWGHSRIRLEPLNPEFEAWDLDEEDDFQVIGEFVCVLDQTDFIKE